MNENLIENQSATTLSQKFIKYYKENKILLFFSLSIIIIIFISFIFYFETKEKKRIILSENYIEAKIYIEQGNKNKAANILETIILSNDKTYSALSLFLLINEKLIQDDEKILNFFTHILENNKFNKEIENLILFKKVLFQSNFSQENDLLEAIKPLINTETVWKAHALLLMGDYFASKKQNVKARDFYMKILDSKNLNIQQEFKEHARSRLRLITNE